MLEACEANGLPFYLNASKARVQALQEIEKIVAHHVAGREQSDSGGRKAEDATIIAVAAPAPPLAQYPMDNPLLKTIRELIAEESK